ncbi:TatD family hydrolase [Roseomonas sp. NAR14]|uniref:TatD family hydrolase n=1 Tax=Roseomonas acroporae TaxID=2937791 RepID=A0A9X2BSM6_9PROT|nr:TatD family hydrolase [Roseomonas acroporae]MCK8783733.1 TatD family hydrolase [Roseomonas acroporae]
MLIDSHCHLDYFEDAEIEALVARAGEAGVERMVTIGTSVAQAEKVKSISQRFAGVWCSVGVHPHNAGEGELPTVAELVALADHPKVIGFGESGLDYFYDKAPRDRQQESFRRHLRAAREAGLPLAIHTRQADEDTLAILRQEREAGPFEFLLHCFTSGRELAEKAVEMGGYVSFSGILTFPRSQEIRDIARDLPAERLLVETDSPYLAPVPLRGKRCEPAYVAHTASVLAAVRGMTPEALAALTTANFRRLYPRAVA